MNPTMNRRSLKVKEALINPHLPAFRSGHRFLQRPSPQKLFPGSAVILSLGAVIGIVMVLQTARVEAQTIQEPPAAQNHGFTPVSREGEKWWADRYAEKNAEMGKRDIDLLMIGDSITAGFEADGPGAKVWKQYFEPRKAINLGFGGDLIEQVLWRLEHMPKLKKAPKGAVVLIGTNNICWGSTPRKQAAEGIQVVARKLQELYPETKILVLAVFPRRGKPTNPFRLQINELNSYLPELLKDMKNVTLLDIGPKFLDEKGYLLKDVMPDGTHPSEAGYEIWAKAIDPELKKMLGE
jgi:beta-glucosidase